MPQLTIIRGLPGTGKTEFAKKNFQAVILEADMYFVRDSEYTFDGTKLREAHGMVRGLLSRIIGIGADAVVTGTFSREWELAGLLRIGQEGNYQIKVLEMPDMFYGNPHNIPQYVIDTMKQRREEISDELVQQYRISLQRIE